MLAPPHTHQEALPAIITLLAKQQSSALNGRDAMGFTPLVHAARVPPHSPLYPVALAHLLGLGADTGIADGEGFTPLHHACALLHEEAGWLLCAAAKQQQQQQQRGQQGQGQQGQRLTAGSGGVEKGAGAGACLSAGREGVPSPLMLLARAAADGRDVQDGSGGGRWGPSSLAHGREGEDAQALAAKGGSSYSCRAHTAEDLVQALVDAGESVVERERVALCPTSDMPIPPPSPALMPPLPRDLFLRASLPSGPTDSSCAAPHPTAPPRGLVSIALALGEGSEGIARKLVGLGAPVTDLFCAAFLGMVGPMEKLVGEAQGGAASGKGVKGLEGRVHGLTPLMWAARRGHAECVEELLRLGACARAEDRSLGPPRAAAVAAAQQPVGVAGAAVVGAPAAFAF